MEAIRSTLRDEESKERAQREKQQAIQASLEESLTLLAGPFEGQKNWEEKLAADPGSFIKAIEGRVKEFQRIQEEKSSFEKMIIKKAPCKSNY